MALSIGFFLWAIRKKVEGTPGVLFMIYLILNGIERFFIEKIRVNDLLIDTPSLKMTQAEIIAIMLFIIGIVGWFVLSRRKTTVNG
jgi:phosphatidylglycerol---prolipoprotein diacylglyceryl transferase